MLSAPPLDSPSPGLSCSTPHAVCVGVAPWKGGEGQQNMGVSCSTFVLLTVGVAQDVDEDSSGVEEGVEEGEEPPEEGEWSESEEEEFEELCTDTVGPNLECGF